MDTLHSMKLFAEVVDSGSFSAAGRRFGLAASSVSRQVGSLEDSLGSGRSWPISTTPTAPSPIWRRCRAACCA